MRVWVFVIDATERIRAFLAVAPSSALRATLVEWGAAARGAPWAKSVRWVRPDSLHLTLRFLGSVTPAALDVVAARVGERVSAQPSLRVAISGIEAFPSARRPRVIVAVVAASPALLALAAAVEEAVAESGLEPEPRPFRPHITLGRLRGGTAGAIEIEQPGERPELAVDELVLYRSTLAHSGARYTALVRMPLAGSSESGR